jgi:hypothetical protein
MAEGDEVGDEDMEELEWLLDGWSMEVYCTDDDVATRIGQELKARNRKK